MVEYIVKDKLGSYVSYEIKDPILHLTLDLASICSDREMRVHKGRIVTEEQIEEQVNTLVDKIYSHYQGSIRPGESLLLVNVKHAATPFYRMVKEKLEVKVAQEDDGFRVQGSHIDISSYGGTNAGDVQVIQHLKYGNNRDVTDLSKHHVLVLDGVLDTGATLHYFVNTYLNDQRFEGTQPQSRAISALFEKDRKNTNKRIARWDKDCAQLNHWNVYKIPDWFIVGFGLDFKLCGNRTPEYPDFHMCRRVPGVYVFNVDLAGKLGKNYVKRNEEGNFVVADNAGSLRDAIYGFRREFIREHEYSFFTEK